MALFFARTKTCISAIWLILSTLLLLPTATARQHRMFVGNQRAPAVIHTVNFDDSTNYFWEEAALLADSPQAWLAFNFDTTKVYGVSLDTTHLTTYAVNSTSLQKTTTVEFRGRCANKTSGYVVASRRFPNYVFSSSWGGSPACGQASFVDPDGDLRGVASSWTYANASIVHGLELGRGYGQVVYSADAGVDAIWTHAFGMYGEAYFLGRYNVPRGSGPKHLAAHSFGKYIYAAMETTNQLVPYLVDRYSGVVRYNDSAYSLLPPGVNPADYAAADLKIARNDAYLWAVTQSRSAGSLDTKNSDSRNFNSKYYNASHDGSLVYNQTSTSAGYLSGFLLDDDGGIIKKMFTVPLSTPTTGVSTGVGTKKRSRSARVGLNALAPAPWGSEWVALTDSTTGYIEMWQMVQGRDTNYGTDYKSSRAVARLDISDGGCCANAVWYN